MQTDVSVVIPCRNEARTIVALLEALAVQSTRPREVVVVDDGSTDGTAVAVAAWASRQGLITATVVPGAGRGAGAAMNTGITRASGTTIVRLDGHCLPDSHYIERSVETLALPEAGVAGGVWRIAPGEPSLTARAIAAVLSHPLGSGGAEYRRYAPAEQEIFEVDTVPFGAFRKSIWVEVGGFDETLVRNQDYDFNYRVKLTGRRVLLNPGIVSVYKARSTFRALRTQYFGYGFWKIVMLKKFPKSIRVRQLLAMVLLPVLASVAAAALISESWLLISPLAAYLALNLAGATQASVRAGDIRLIPAATVALLTLQNAWSAGAWASLFRGARAPQR